MLLPRDHYCEEGVLFLQHLVLQAFATGSLGLWAPLVGLTEAAAGLPRVAQIAAAFQQPWGALENMCQVSRVGD